jgi:hypothetical protein
MSPQIRAILAIVAGVLAGGAVIAAIQSLSPYHPPEGVTPNNPTVFSEWTRSLPTAAYMYVLVSYLTGSFAGGFLTNLISRPTKYSPALITGFGLTIFAVGNFLAFTHPEWLTYSSCIGLPVLAWIGGWLSNVVFPKK